MTEASRLASPAARTGAYDRDDGAMTVLAEVRIAAAVVIMHPPAVATPITHERDAFAPGLSHRRVTLCTRRLAVYDFEQDEFPALDFAELGERVGDLWIHGPYLVE